MIYIKNTTDAQTMFVPRNGEAVSGDMDLHVRNTTDQVEFTIPVTDLGTSGLYFNVAFSLPEGIAVGEYEYRLKSGLIVLSCGLLFIGDLIRPGQHEETIKYRQYESE